MTTYKPPVMVQTDAPDPDFTLTFAGNGFQDNAWITVDDLFCVNIIRTGEGIVIDVWPKEDNVQSDAPVATLCAETNDVLPFPLDD